MKVFVTIECWCDIPNRVLAGRGHSRASVVDTHRRHRTGGRCGVASAGRG